MKVVPVPVLDDNYAYLLIDQELHIAAAVDPAVPEKILDAAQKEGVKITTILTTHHHWDHAGGNAGMLERIPNAKVVGGDARIGGLNHQVKDGDSLQIGNIDVKVFFTPCHTSGHVLYFVTNKKDDKHPAALFTGDTLFIGGCGRFFEGTADQMHHALNSVIGGLPDATLVYCGHEYTKKNLEFAASVDPENAAVREKLDAVIKLRAKGMPTIPSTVGDEKAFNPFMRVSDASIHRHLGLDSPAPVDVMAELRKRKDKF